MNNPIILLIVGGLGLVGCLILLLVGVQMLREEQHKKERQPQDGAPEQTSSPANAATAAQPSPRPVETGRPSGRPARRNSSHEVLRVLRDNLTGRLLIEIAATRYSSLKDIQDVEVQQGLLTTLHDLREFVGQAGDAPETRPAVAREAHRLPAANAPSPAASGPSPQPRGPAEKQALPAPSMNPFKQMQVLRQLAKNPPPAPKSIAEQVEEVLQGRIVGTPLVQRGLHMRPGPRGDAVFELEGQTYVSVEEVPEAEVRDVIRAAIADWEKEQ